MNQFSKYQLATAIAILFHTVGLAGILIFKSEVIIKTTPVNMLLMLALILYTDENKIMKPIVFFMVCFFVGFIAEWIGTSTGYLFGSYKYSDVLGATIFEVPIIIGVNWFLIMYCCAMTIRILLSTIVAKMTTMTGVKGRAIKSLSIIVDGATLATLFDWLMEPVAVELKYWQWLGSGAIPLFNYLCWFVLSIFFLFVFNRLRFEKANKFAVNLLLIQAMFFLLLRTFL